MEAKKFLDPESMITPGIAGGITMTISNALWVQFSLEPRYTGLVLSFLIGLAVVLAWKASSSLWLKGIYWILNSLIIFSVAVGGNYIGTASAKATPLIQENQISSVNPIINELKTRKGNLEQEILKSNGEMKSAEANVKKAQEMVAKAKEMPKARKMLERSRPPVENETNKLSSAKTASERLANAKKELAQATEKKKITEAEKRQTEQTLLELEQQTLKPQNKPIEKGRTFFRSW